MSQRALELFVWAFLVAEAERQVEEYNAQCYERVEGIQRYFPGQMARARNWRPLELTMQGPTALTIVSRLGEWPNESEVWVEWAIDSSILIRARCKGVTAPEITRQATSVESARSIASSRVAAALAALRAHNSVPLET